MHAPVTQTALQNLKLLKDILGRLLSLVEKHQQVQTSCLMHLLISLSYLNVPQHQKTCDQLSFTERISSFVEEYSRKPTSLNENDEIDKRTVLDLCAHMFHPQVNASEDATLEYNDMRPDDKIREFENEQGDLIFECFLDEETVM